MIKLVSVVALMTLLYSSVGGQTHHHTVSPKDSIATCHVPMPSKRKIVQAKVPQASAHSAASIIGMRNIPGGTFWMGATDDKGRPDEYPLHQVKVKGFWMDETEVTNAQFAAFVA
ncbi:MAG TPA: SUMF1/EgtB/PvdO family nonheme iron enzyme, partial [Haliscomenobacter sp.]|nr:SUMF1/EgtB/PvdO family nonheme iron enzyme [Haliscomenobacter sp.]